MKIFRDKVYEPAPRNKDGVRWIAHRFPIRGGISLRDVMLIEAARPNRLLERLRVKS